MTKTVREDPAIWMPPWFLATFGSKTMLNSRI
jgi:hypothetical protein